MAANDDRTPSQKYFILEVGAIFKREVAISLEELDSEGQNLGMSLELIGCVESSFAAYN